MKNKIGYWIFLIKFKLTKKNKKNKKSNFIY